MTSMRVCDAMLPALSLAFGSDAAETAQVIAGFALAYGVMQLVYGPLGDRFGRVRVVTGAALGCSLAALAAASSPSLDALNLARVAMGVGAAGIIPTALAWIGDSFALTQRQEVLARYMGATVMGMMTGAWAGGLFAQTVGWRWAFVSLAVLFALVALALVHALRQGAGQVPPPEVVDLGQAPAPATPRPSFVAQLRDVLSRPWSRWVMFVVAVEGGIVFGVTAFVPSVLHARFGLPLSQAGAVLAAFGLGGLVFSRLAARLLRRFGPPTVAAGGTLTLVAGLLMLAFMPHWAFSIPGCGVAGLGFYALHNALQLNATQLSPQARGTGVSLFASALFFGQSAGVAISARAFAVLSPALCFGVAAAGMALLGLVFAQSMRRQPAAAV